MIKSIEHIKIDESDKTKSIALIKIGDSSITIEYWNSLKYQCGENLNDFLFAEAYAQLGDKEEAIESLLPFATGEDTTFFEQKIDSDGNPITEFGGEDTRNWAQKRIDELN